MVKRIYNSNEAKEYRRIIKSGDSFVISIPKQWMDQNKLKHRDELECLVSKDKIIITNNKLKGGDK